MTAKAKSKNVFQNRIKQAVNFQGSPIHELLLTNGQGVDIPELDEQDDAAGNGQSGAATPQSSGASAAAPSSTTSPSDDALSGIV